MHEIIPNLFISNNLIEPKKGEIDHIISLGLNLKKIPGILETFVPINNIDIGLDFALPIINDLLSKNKKILILSKEGANLCTTFTFIYLCKYRKMSINDAKKLLNHNINETIKNYLKNDIDEFL